MNSCIYCSNSVPEGFTKCFKCAMRRGKDQKFDSWKPTSNEFVTYPVSQQSDEYKKLEYIIEKATCVTKWNDQWTKAYIYNQIDMALIVNNKEQFTYWSKQLQEFKEDVV